MLSLRVKPIRQASDAARYYFSKDNYYFTGELIAAWQGQSALKLELGERVSPEQLEMILSGVLPTGEIIGLRSANGEIKHRGGYDLTFCAPKSVSYLALVSGEKDFIDMHQRAVQKVLQIIEKEAAEARKMGLSGEVEYEKTMNLAFATILHDTSRDQDPFLHTHALMMNLTERLDGQWRSLASDMKKNHGTMEWIMANQIFLGLVYRSEIALSLKSKGLEIEQTGDPHGLFEIKHVNPELLITFSKRRTDIEERAETMHSNSLKAYDKAAKDTREYKKETNPDVLRAKWTAESQALGVEPSTYLNELKQITLASKSISKDRAANERCDVVLNAITHLEERKLSFSYQDILQASLYFSQGEVGYDTLIQDINHEIKTRHLIALDNKESRLTTSGLIAKEKHLIEQLSTVAPQKKGMKLDDKNTCSKHVPESIQNTVARVLEEKQSIIRIQQQSIASKEVLLALIDNASDSKTIRVLTPSRMLAKSVNEATTKKPETIWQWLSALHKSELAQTIAGFNHEHKDSHRLPFFKSRKEQELIIVDDVGRCAPDELSQLLSIASKSRAKVILLEKSEGLTGLKSDIPSLLDKAAVLTYQAFDKPKNAPNMQLHEAHDKTARLLKVASEYTKLTDVERKNTAVLTISKAESWEVNQRIRHQLKEAGALSTIEKELKTLLPISLTAIEKKTAKSYQPGWVLHQKSPHKTQQFKIISIDEKKGSLVVCEEGGRQTLLPVKSITQQSHVYEERLLPVSIGEQLVTTSDMKPYGVKAGTAYEVTAFTRYGLKLKSGQKEIHLLNTNHLPLTYSYAKNLHAHDYKTVDKTILTMPSYALNKNIMALSTETSRQSIEIITDDVEKARRHASRLSVKPSAISIVIDASSVSNGIKVIDNQTTNELLRSLEKAIATLTKDKPDILASEKALEFAIAHLSERETVFSKNDLLTVAMNKAIGEANVDELSVKINRSLQDGRLLSSDDGKLMTIEAKSFEEQILSTVRSGKNRVTPILDLKSAEEKLSTQRLTEGQKEASLLIATTSDRFTMIQGFAGTGKTTMTKSVIEVIQTANELGNTQLDIIAIAPTHQAVKEMRALGITAQTLKSFLIEQEDNPTLSSQSLVLLDESSMVSNRDAARLVSFIDAANSRCTLLGDVSQHQAIESGKPSAILLQEGSIQTAVMSNLVRQQVQQYKKAVETLIQGDTNKALTQLSQLPLKPIEREGSHPVLDSLKTSVVVAGDSEAEHKNNKPIATSEGALWTNVDTVVDVVKDETPLTMAVKDYLSRTAECRENTIVVIHENKDREIANQLIRKGLIEKAAIGRESKPFMRLLSTNYTTAELYQAETFAEILKKPDTYFLKKNNQYYKVVGIDEVSRVVELQHVQGEKSIFLPEKENQDWKIELFKGATGRLSVGEKIHFKKSDKANARFANDKLIVTEVSNDTFSVKDASGNLQTLHKNEFKDTHWDYSYTSTSYSIQGSSSPFVIGVANTGNKKTNHFRSFYITVSRGSVHAMIYTDDYNKLKHQLGFTPNKTSALEELGIIPSAQKNKPSFETEKQAEKTLAVTKNVDQKPRYDAKEVVHNLSLNAEYVVQHLLGTPNARLTSKKEMRYGSKGSLSISLQGDKRGTWFNFETGEKGNLLHLIQSSLNLDFKSSLEYAAKITGDDLKETVHSPIKTMVKSTKKNENEPSKARIYARLLSKESLPIHGTLAEIYLKETRGITNLSGHNIRFHPSVFTDKSETIKNRPALLCIARDKDNVVQSVQAIYIDNTTFDKANINIDKKTYGANGGTGVIVSEGITKDAVTYITEGIETGLSVRDAVQNERVITVLGKQNMTSIDINLLTEKVVLCLDNDGKTLHDDKILNETIKRLKLHGKEVEIAIPNKNGDFNDVVKSEGVSGIINILNKSFKPESLKENGGKISMTNTQISVSMERITRDIKLDNQPIKTPPIEQTKTLQRLNLEIG